MKGKKLVSVAFLYFVKFPLENNYRDTWKWSTFYPQVLWYHIRHFKKCLLVTHGNA